MQLGGRFVLREPLAEGGMGEIWIAFHLDLGREVAVKVIKPMVSDQHRAVERFLREARTVASLSPPHILEVFDLATL